MKLIYKETGHEVKLGDLVSIHDETFVISFFRPPHKPASSGKVSVRVPNEFSEREYYVGVIGAEWIEREDRAQPQQEQSA